MADINAPLAQPAHEVQVPEWIPPDHTAIDLSSVTPEERESARCDRDKLNYDDSDPFEPAATLEKSDMAQAKIAAAPDYPSTVLGWALWCAERGWYVLP